jgi:MFS family permease
MLSRLECMRRAFAEAMALAPDDLLRDATYRRLWSSILISSFGAQVTMLALPLTAAVLLHATPTQMGLLTAMEIVPFVLFSLPSGVWLDRVRKLPVYVVGETMVAFCVASVPLAWWQGWLSMVWMYFVAFVIGAVNTTAGSAAQIVLTQVVARERLVEAHAKNALATSGSEVAGPALAGVLIKLLGAPLALLFDAAGLLASATILRGIRVHESPRVSANAHFWRDLRAGVRFVRSQRLLVSLAVAVGVWQMCHHAAIVVQILLRHTRSGSDRAGRGPELHGHGRRHDHRQRARQPHQPARRAGTLPGDRLRRVRRGLAAGRRDARQWARRRQRLR